MMCFESATGVKKNLGLVSRQGAKLAKMRRFGILRELRAFA